MDPMIEKLKAALAVTGLAASLQYVTMKKNLREC